MDITPPLPENAPVLQSYGPGRFTITGTVWTRPVIVLPNQTLSWTVTEFEDITAESLSPVLEAVPPVELLIVGSGGIMRRLPGPLQQLFAERGVGLDSMATGAACRSFAALMAEGRQVAAALFPLPAEQ